MQDPMLYHGRGEGLCGLGPRCCVGGCPKLGGCGPSFGSLVDPDVCVFGGF